MKYEMNFERKTENNAGLRKAGQALSYILRADPEGGETRNAERGRRNVRFGEEAKMRTEGTTGRTTLVNPCFARGGYAGHSLREVARAFLSFLQPSLPRADPERLRCLLS